MGEGIRMEVIEVVARFDHDGNLTPLRFTWRGSEYRISSTGRIWEDEAGRHFMVMVPGEQIYELLFVPNEMLWHIKRSRPAWA